MDSLYRLRGATRRDKEGSLPTPAQPDRLLACQTRLPLPAHRGLTDIVSVLAAMENKCGCVCSLASEVPMGSTIISAPAVIQP